MSESTGTSLTAPTAPTDSEIARIRQRGEAAIAHRREVARMAKVIAGLEWGAGSQAVRGSAFSPATQYALAEFCRITRANPQTHVDILGGKPYLNADYWKDRVSSDPLFYREDQREISATTEAGLRERVDGYRSRAGELPTDAQERVTLLSRATELEIEADEIARARAHYRPPEWATHVYETVIIRFIPAAPIEKIRAGEIVDLEPYLREVRECNWAGGRPDTAGKKDPVGNAEPEKTARTRSFRRAATKAFPAWMEAYEDQIRKAEEIIVAEFEEIVDVPTGGDQAVLASGEPEAVGSADANELPGTIDPAAHVEPTAAPAAEWDRDDTRKRYFATLRDAGITEEAGRKAWQSDNGLPESTSEWSRADFDRAIELLVGPERRRYIDACRVMGVSSQEFALNHLERLPEYLKDFQQLNRQLNAVADRAAEAGAR